MMRGDEMAQAAGAASPGDTLAGSPRRAMVDSGRRSTSPLPRVGQSAPAYSGGIDRLARLARLIEQDETLAAIVRGGRPEEKVELLPRREKLASFHPAREDKAFEHNGEGEAGSPLVPASLCDGPSGEAHDPPEYGEYDVPDYSNGLPDQWRGLKVFATLIGLALAGSASAFAYWTLSDGRGRSGEAPVMAASTGPDKTAPSPREHSRVDEGLRDRSDERSVNATGRTMIGAEEPADASPPMPQAPPPTGLAFGPAPTGLAFGPAPTKMAELIPGPTPAGSPAAMPQNQPPEVTKPALRQTARGAAGPSGGPGVRYVVQLCSERGEEAALASSRALQTKYPGAFAGRKPFIRRAHLGDRGVYYRVQMGPFAIGEANQICENLKKSGADCLVQRNHGRAAMLKDDP